MNLFGWLTFSPLLPPLHGWLHPALASIGDKEWFFYVPRDRKYRNGDRPNRVTPSGYWKATGADRLVKVEGKGSIGLKKTLVFYVGKAPKGLRSSWIMNEYRLPLHHVPEFATDSCWEIFRFSVGRSVAKRLASNVLSLVPKYTIDCLSPKMSTYRNRLSVASSLTTNRLSVARFYLSVANRAEKN